MFKKYGVAGIILIVLVEINFFLKIQPFANWYFPIIWFSYILVIDALIYKIKRRSLISNHFFQFIGLMILSALFWYIFEFINLSVQNWKYIGTGGLGAGWRLFALLSFSTVLPAFFETVELIRTVHLFDKAHIRKKFKIRKGFLYGMIVIGVICFIAPFIFPKYTFPLVWLSFFLILDPINYIHNQPSIIRHFKNRRLAVPLSLLLAGIILGFFWEFWNYWAIPKWQYDVPFLGFFKIFEMPILGYLEYFPFSFELYAMYWFVRSLFIEKGKNID